MNFIDKYIMPFANKLGNNRHLLAIRDALVGMIAITMIGSLSVLVTQPRKSSGKLVSPMKN